MTKIAIIGSAGLFPGSSTKEAFWENLMLGKDLTDLANEEDFGANPAWFFNPEKGVVDCCYSLRGGYIRGFKFDPSGYQLPADYLARQDKLYQWSLYVAKEALLDSGYLQDIRSKEKCGLVLGNLSFPTSSSHKLLSPIYTQTVEAAAKELFQDRDFKMPRSLKELPQNEILEYSPSQMVIEALGLSANHYEIDAACATSLYAIKLASDELVTGKSDMMLAGAVCASDQLFIHMGFSIFHAYAPADEKFVPFDLNSSGLVSSEGAGMVVLKRLTDAERDGDTILGVIGGIGLSNDGRGKFLLSPNPKGQRLAFERAYNTGDISPEKTSYLECHATGTPLGDITEINSIADFFKQHNTKPLLGSVKSNMGHLLTVAGISGLLKVLFAMQKGTIPPNVNLEKPVEADNRWIGGEQMISSPTKWNGTEKQAGINSFGFGGTNAHMVVLKSSKNQSHSSSDNKVDLLPMAVIGMDVHFGDCKNLDDFYHTIYFGKQHFNPLPQGRWKGFDENQDLLKSYGFEDGLPPKGAYIEDVEIDLLRYKIQPKEAETLEPQQALILKVADNAIKDAGLRESQNVAVIIAMEPELAIHHYLARWDITWQLKEALKQSNIALDTSQEKDLEEFCKNGLYYRDGAQTPSQHTSFVGNIMASRIAALWDFSGPAFTVSCGENSVFKALEIAQNMLSLGEVEAVVVGGVDLSGGLESVLLRNQKEETSKNPNPSLSLNKDANGWLIGEGAGAIVLKEKRAAEKEKVYAVIDGIGKARPIHEGGYMELAATGNPRHDEIETQFLLQNKPRESVALGSIKANIGNTYAASGMASLIKTALCVYHRFIPAIPNWDSPKHDSSFEDSNYYFPAESRPWILENGQNYRSAAINGLGDIQIKLSEWTGKRKIENTFLRNTELYLFPIKGSSGKELISQLSDLEGTFETNASLPDIGRQYYQTFIGNSSNYCLVLMGKDRAGLLKEVQFFQKNVVQSLLHLKPLKTPGGSYFTPTPLGKKGKIAFVYPGSSTAYIGLGRDLFQLFPQLYVHFNEMNVNLDKYVCSNYLYPKQKSITETPLDLYENAIAMMSVGVFYATSFTHILRSFFKLEPDIAFGYSMGECSSMWYSMGVWGAEEARDFQESPIFKNRFAGNLELLAEHWGTNSEEAKKRWISLVLLAPKEEVERLVDAEKRVYLSFINTKREVVISGDKDACLNVAKQLKCPVVPVPFQNIIHHDFCIAEKDGLLSMHNFPLREIPDVDFYSSISKSNLELDSQKISENSTAVCCHRIDFPSTVNAVYSAGANIFIELGAHATCTNWINDILEKQAHLAISINHKGKSDKQSLLELVARLLSHGISLDLSILYPPMAKTEKRARFMKKIKLGGKRIYDTILSPALKQRFGMIEKGKEIKELVISQPDKSGPLAVHSSDKAMQTPPSLSVSYVPPIESNASMVKDMVENHPGLSTARYQVAENGLRLQNFESGEQLTGKEIIFTEEDLETFATGKIADVFGEEYAIIDSYPRRVMLPMHPYLLVSRVTGLDAKMGEFKPATMQTEYDIPYNAWFTTDRQIPWAVSVESGQCDLLLISYLGIDFQNKGDLVYRLLDCTLTFIDDLPFEGQTLRYDISINSFVRNADNLLFFFSYNCYVQDRLVLKMDGGCAGFFTDNQLAQGKGVVYSESEIAAKRTAKKKYFTPLLKTHKTTFSKHDLLYLIHGDIEKCFENEAYYANGRNPSLCLPPEKILMIDRITSVDLKGGAYGLGYIVAEKDLHADDWYFPCHFRDDEVLAGSLQAEGGGNLLRFFMLMLGLQRLTKDARYQPIFDLPQKVRCRKEVTPIDTVLVYKLEIKEVGLVPNPYVIGDLEIITDGIVTVHFENLGLQLREKSNPRYLENSGSFKISPRSEGALMNEIDIATFALDDLSKCFGPDFSVYDGRTVSRQPNTDLQLISRVLKVEGKRGEFDRPSVIFTEYDVPEDVWYFVQNSFPTMPYSILMEIALQPCGLLGAYLGTTLQFPDKNLFFRNLDGEGELFDLENGTDFRGKTIKNKSILVSSVSLGGTILQNYTFELSVEDQIFFKGKSSFGFFPGDALDTQVGLDKGAEVSPWYIKEQLIEKDYMQIKLDSLYGKTKLFKAPDSMPHYRLAENQLNLLDKLIIAKDSGRYDQGYIYGTKLVKPYDWYFTCHFYQDPVMPGSLGVESILQAMQVFALQQNLGKDFRSPKFVQLMNHKTIWKYRGQILLTAKEMHVEVHIKAMEKRGNQLAIIADAFLWNHKMRIYQVTNLALGIAEA